MRTLRLATVLAVALCCLCGDILRAFESPQVRIKDITDVAGEIPEDLLGFGLVIGLAGTGGSSDSTKRALIELEQKMGLRADPQIRAAIQRAREKTDNISLVMVKATLGPYTKRGQRIDVIVATADDAESLNGGMLLRTPLKGVDDVVYAVATGPISTNGGEFGGTASSVVKNHPTTGRVPGGAVVVEQKHTQKFYGGVKFQLLLRAPSLESAANIATAVNTMAPETATIVDPSTVEVRLPYQVNSLDLANRFLFSCKELMVTPGTLAKVIINERTGTVVFTEDVRLSGVAITHGNLIVTTVESPEVSQPEAFGAGDTVVVPRTDVGVTEENRRINVIPTTPTVSDLAASLNALGVSPRDLSSIFQMLKETGALHAQLELK
ncbi:MAG: flagellar basal body P-ring protein FlgI [Fuerstiella sp.]|nr:flagellar basal body P-ring protein FlgI [Fuerstiella sp.]